MTTKAQVQAALDKGWELYEEVRKARAEGQRARSAYSAIQSEAHVDELKERAALDLAGQLQGYQATHDRHVAAAQAKLDHARAEYEKAVAESEKVRRAASDKVEAESEAKTKALVDDLRMRVATAQAEAHKLEQHAASLQAGLDAFTKATQQELGIDLKTFFEG